MYFLTFAFFVLMTLVLREIANDTRQVDGEVICVEPVPWRIGDTIMVYVLDPVFIEDKSLQEFHREYFDDPNLASLRPRPES